MSNEGLMRARMRGLVDAVGLLAGAGSIEEVVEIIRRTGRRLIGSDGITVILRDEDRCHYVEEDAIRPLWRGQKFPMQSCISGIAMMTGDTVVIPDIAKDPRVPYHLYSETFVKSMVMVPVRVDDPLGAIGAYWSEAFEPSADTIETLEMLARAAATAFENARLLQSLSNALADAEHARDELRHRVKNSFTAAQALAVLSIPPAYSRTLTSRLSALARAHELIDQKLAREATISLGDLVEAELAAYRNEIDTRIHIEGPRIILESAQAIALGLVLNELATNALKHGALSTRTGSVGVDWRLEQNHLMIEWRESDGPEVRAAAMESFGSRLLKRLVEGQLKGTLHRTLERRGVTCSIALPLVTESLPVA